MRTEWTPEQVAPNPIIKRINLARYPGWVIRMYQDGTYDATNGRAVSTVESSFQDALYFVKHGELIIK